MTQQAPSSRHWPPILVSVGWRSSVRFRVGPRVLIRHRSDRRVAAGYVVVESLRFKQLIEQVLGREDDLIDYGGLKLKLDDDIRREAALL